MKRSAAAKRAAAAAAAAAAAPSEDAAVFAAASPIDAAAAAQAAAIDDPFASEVLTAFSDLIYRPARVIEAMRPAGPRPNAGDGIVAMPTLVHRGPGGNDSRATERSVLFFVLQPTFPSDGEEEVWDGEAGFTEQVRSAPDEPAPDEPAPDEPAPDEQPTPDEPTCLR